MSTRHDLYDPACVFCQIPRGDAPATILNRWPDDGRGCEILVIEPLTPVTPGHVLVIPDCHVYDAGDDPIMFAETAEKAAAWARIKGYKSANILTSMGAAATQSVMHLHVHVVPRTEDDGLMLPWGTIYGDDPTAPHWCRVAAGLQSEIEALEEHMRREDS